MGNATLLDSLLFPPLCAGWSNATEGAVYHLGNAMLFLGYMGGSGAHGCLFIFGFLAPAHACLVAWGLLTACGLDVAAWNLLLLLACLAQAAHLLSRLHRERVRGGEELGALYRAVYLPLGVPPAAFRDIAGAFDNKVFNVYFSVVNSWLSSHIWLFRLVIEQLIDASCRQRAWQPQRAVQPRHVILSVRVA
ncbi:Popeye domain-containing protein 2 [Liparis tanakae]|uniref:Popeye domain-containing protein 2 n=1 Tax=Liparis tanakae TaxID=230148 RepID=A0A4Z2G237_9TELE|nr:Popeye domain-containing protein 2 [Liparis tanakae]